MSRYKIIFICIHFTLALICCPLFSFAEWQGPEEIIHGSWGENAGQFYFDPQDTSALFPKDIAIDKEGNIIIRDEGNRRILIYNTNGILKNVIRKPTELPEADSLFFWPTEFKLLSNKHIVIFCDYEKISGGIKPLQQCFLDYHGKIIKKIDMGELFPADDGYILKKKDIYYAYTFSGQLLKTYNERPLELGNIKEKSLGDSNWQAMIKYPDKTYTLKRIFGEYIRGYCQKDLFAITGKTIERFNREGESIGELVIPEDKWQPKDPRFKDFDLPLKVIEQYGNPVISPIGDVYCWKRTPETYSILKWMWIESPDSPLNLKAEASETNISLTWERPKEDSDNVTGYEIVRSTEVCGPFEEIGEVKKGVLNYVDKDVKAGEVYYYQVRAIKDKGYSGYSNKAVGSIGK